MRQKQGMVNLKPKLKNPMLKSQIFSGFVKHRRYQTRHHSFSYRLFMMLTHVDEIDLLCKESPFWSHNKKNIASFYDDDYLPNYQGSMRDRVTQVLKEKGYSIDPSHDIFILTNWRYFGFLINPITCFYCYNSDNELQYLILEVTNTPWNDRINYLLPCDPKAKFQRLKFAKEMHVSPFYEMNMFYHLNAYKADNQISLHLANIQKHEKVFDATLNLKPQHISKNNLFKVLAKYPFMTLKVALGIYWQALKLWMKGVKYINPPQSRKTKPTDGSY